MKCAPDTTARANDDWALSMMSMRCDGWSSGEIATFYDITSEKVRVATSRPMKADIAESGEELRTVLNFYWSTDRHAVDGRAKVRATA